VLAGQQGGQGAGEPGAERAGRAISARERAVELLAASALAGQGMSLASGPRVLLPVGLGGFVAASAAARAVQQPAAGGGAWTRTGSMESPVATARPAALDHVLWADRWLARFAGASPAALGSFDAARSAETSFSLAQSRARAAAEWAPAWISPSSDDEPGRGGRRPGLARAGGAWAPALPTVVVDEDEPVSDSVFGAIAAAAAAERRAPRGGAAGSRGGAAGSRGGAAAAAGRAAVRQGPVAPTGPFRVPEADRALAHVAVGGSAGLRAALAASPMASILAGLLEMAPQTPFDPRQLSLASVREFFARGAVAARAVPSAGEAGRGAALDQLAWRAPGTVWLALPGAAGSAARSGAGGWVAGGASGAIPGGAAGWTGSPSGSSSFGAGGASGAGWPGATGAGASWPGASGVGASGAGAGWPGAGASGAGASWPGASGSGAGATWPGAAAGWPGASGSSAGADAGWPASGSATSRSGAGGAGRAGAAGAAAQAPVSAADAATLASLARSRGAGRFGAMAARLGGGAMSAWDFAAWAGSSESGALAPRPGDMGARAESFAHWRSMTASDLALDFLSPEVLAAARAAGMGPIEAGRAQRLAASGRPHLAALAAAVDRVFVDALSPGDVGRGGLAARGDARSWAYAAGFEGAGRGAGAAVGASTAAAAQIAAAERASAVERAAAGERAVLAERAVTAERAAAERAVAAERLAAERSAAERTSQERGAAEASQRAGWERAATSEYSAAIERALAGSGFGFALRGGASALWAAAAMRRAAPFRIPRGAFLLPDAALRSLGIAAGAAETLRPNIGVALDLVAASQVADAAASSQSGAAARAFGSGDQAAGASGVSGAAAGQLGAAGELGAAAAADLGAPAWRRPAEAARAQLPPELWSVFDAVYLSLGEGADARPLAPSARAARALALASRSSASATGGQLSARARAAAAWAVLPVVLPGGSASVGGSASLRGAGAGAAGFAGVDGAAGLGAAAGGAAGAADADGFAEGGRSRAATRAGQALGALVAPTFLVADGSSPDAAAARAASRGEARASGSGSAWGGVETPMIQTSSPRSSSSQSAPPPQPRPQPSAAQSPAGQPSGDDMAWFVEAAKKYFSDAGPASGGSGLSVAEMTLVTAAPRAQIAASARTADRPVAQAASTTHVGGQAKPGEAPSAGKPDVDKIAQEVFEQICRMMAVARERSGDPWQR
jgi:hypothetical protein